MQTANFHYIPNHLTKTEQYDLINYLDNIDFINVPTFNDSNMTSRFQKWYQMGKKYFCPLWKNRFPQWESHEIDSTILSLIKSVQNFVEKIPAIDIPTIDSCLINKYPTGQNFIAPHRDSPDSFGLKPTIVILSLGETRTLKFENNKETFSFDLESGSIFIMSGNSQTDYMHSLEKSDTINCRYSLTFREFIL